MDNKVVSWIKWRTTFVETLFNKIEKSLELGVIIVTKIRFIYDAVYLI